MRINQAERSSPGLFQANILVVVNENPAAYWIYPPVKAVSAKKTRPPPTANITTDSTKPMATRAYVGVSDAPAEDIEDVISSLVLIMVGAAEESSSSSEYTSSPGLSAVCSCKAAINGLAWGSRLRKPSLAARLFLSILRTLREV